MTASARKQVLRDLKTRIADRAAVCDIEVNCSSRKIVDGAAMYDINSASPESAEWVRQACIYLCMRGLVCMRGNFVEIPLSTLEVAND